MSSILNMRRTVEPHSEGLKIWHVASFNQYCMLLLCCAKYNLAHSMDVRPKKRSHWFFIRILFSRQLLYHVYLTSLDAPSLFDNVRKMLHMMIPHMPKSLTLLFRHGNNYRWVSMVQRSTSSECHVVIIATTSHVWQGGCVMVGIALIFFFWGCSCLGSGIWIGQQHRTYCVHYSELMLCDVCLML